MRVVDLKLQPKMREDMDDRAVEAFPVCLEWCVLFSLGGTGRRRLGQPIGARHFRHAAKQAVIGAPAKQDGTVFTHGNEGGSDPDRTVEFLGSERKELRPLL